MSGRGPRRTYKFPPLPGMVYDDDDDIIYVSRESPQIPTSSRRRRAPRPRRVATSEVAVIDVDAFVLGPSTSTGRGPRTRSCRRRARSNAPITLPGSPILLSESPIPLSDPPMPTTVDQTESGTTASDLFLDEPSTSTGVTNGSSVQPSGQQTEYKSLKAVMKEMDDLMRECEKSIEPSEAVKITCPICFEKATSTMTTKCGHVFCEPCIKKVASRPNPTCPKCRKRITKANLIHIYL